MSNTTPPSRFLVLAPGLLGPWPAPPVLAPTASLDLLLARADCTSAPAVDLTRALLDTFGATASAPYALAADDPAWDRTGRWLHADPVHLRADRDRLRLFDAGLLDITPTEAAALVAALNAHFADDRLWFSAPGPTRWYVRVTDLPAIAHASLAQMAGQCLNARLPDATDARRWGRLMNEAQMLLFQAPENSAREARGRPTINGVWTWGGGAWAALTPPAPLAGVIADLPLAWGLAAAAGVPVRAPGAGPDDGMPWPVGTTLLVAETIGAALARRDEGGWGEAVSGLDRWLAPALVALRQGRLGEIAVDAGEGRCWRLRRGPLRRFWRRPRPLAGRVTAISQDGGRVRRSGSPGETDDDAGPIVRR